MSSVGELALKDDPSSSGHAGQFQIDGSGDGKMMPGLPGAACAAPRRAKQNVIRRIAAVLTLAGIAPAASAKSALAQVASQEPFLSHAEQRIERLAGVARVWGAAKYFHPSLGQGAAMDWDAALLAALPAVRAAVTPAEYRVAVDALLAQLNDPLTRVIDVRAPAHETGEAEPSEFGVRKVGDGIVIVTVGSYYGLFDPSVQARLGELGDTIAAARAVVFDLRSTAPTDAYGRLQLAGTFAQHQRLLTADTLHSPGERRRVYYGYESPSAFSSGQYRTGLFVRSGAMIAPTQRSRVIPTVFLLNRHAGLLSATLALQAAGRARVVYEGNLNHHTIGEVMTIELADGLEAQVRSAEGVYRDGTSAAFSPDVVVEAPAGLATAVDLAGRPWLARAERPVLPAAAVTVPERSYREMRYPDLDHRLLAAFRLWNAVEYFYPYRDLLDHDWGNALPRLLPQFEDARDAREYTLAVVAMARAIQDSHAYVAGSVYTDEIVGAGYPPIRVRVIEGRPLVTALYDSAAASAAGVRVGDEVVTVDGRSALERLDEVEDWLSTSTPQSRTDRASLTFMNGPVGTPVRLGLRGADGRERDAVLERRREDYSTLYHRERTGEVVRVLPGNIGYVDLDRLTYDGVASMFEALKGTDAIIFDMRGYPRGTVWAIAPNLAPTEVTAALLHTPLVGHGSQGPATETFLQVIQPAPPAERYTGPTVMLVDERAMSQAEHTGLYLRAANGTRFVGSPSAGANGEIVTVTMPGGMTVGFTGQAVTWPDGGQLQRIGLIPDLEVRPTIRGIRAGRDEVLEAALRLLTEGGTDREQ